MGRDVVEMGGVDPHDPGYPYMHSTCLAFFVLVVCCFGGGERLGGMAGEKRRQSRHFLSVRCVLLSSFCVFVCL